MFKQFLNTPFSDLWLPTLAIGLGLIAILLAHWLWCAWRVKRLQAPSHVIDSHASRSENTFDDPTFADHVIAHDFNTAAFNTDIATAIMANDAPVPYQANSGLNDAFSHRANRLHPAATALTRHQQTNKWSNDSHPVPKDFSHLPDLHALTAQKHPVQIETYSADQLGLDAMAPSTNESLLKPLTEHPQFHYAAKLTWAEPQGKLVLQQVLASPKSHRTWGAGLPLDWVLDAQSDCSVLATWQVIDRRMLASSEDAAQFKTWCETIAGASAARCEILPRPEWGTFIDEAHALLIGLDSVIVLKVSVPLVQLDLFAQSLLAARFTQSQEHWQFQDSASNPVVMLERLWHQDQGHNPDHRQGNEQAPSQANSTASNQHAIFQLIIDIPHLDSLEARKVYMRLRAVARASAAILQSAQGVHLSEGMLDRYSRELLLKQEALNQAQVEPGSTLARQVFRPYMQRSTDLTR